MPNFKDPTDLKNMRDISLRRYRETGSKAHLRAANEALFELQKLSKQAAQERALEQLQAETQAAEKPKRGRPKKEQVNGD